MRKVLLVLVISMFSVISFGQEVPEQSSQDLVVRQVPEDTMVYLRTGDTVGRFPDPQDVIMNSVGVLRYAENFIYGLEYNSFYATGIETRSTNVQGLIGYRVIWNKRFLPYGIFQFGHANFKDESAQAKYSGSGLAVTVDVGVDVIKIWKIKGSIGARHTNASFNSKDIPNASFTDLYIMTGFVF